MKKTFALLALLFVFQMNSQTVTTVSGNGTPGTTDGLLNVALFNGPNGLAIDSKGYIICADVYSNLIRKINMVAGTVTTIAGSTAGFADGLGTAAKFNSPTNLSTDAARSIYLSDFANHRIRKIDTLGNVTTLAGTGVGGTNNGLNASATFSNPSAVAYGQNNCYVTDYGNSLIRKINSGTVTTLSGMAGSGYVDGPVAVAKFNHAAALTVDAAGNVIICDRGNHLIRKIDTFGNVTTIAGSTQGYQDGPANTAKFNDPTGITVDMANNMYLTDYGNNKIRKIDALGNVTTVAGAGSGFADGVGTAALFNGPASLVLDLTQNYIYVADLGNNRIRKIFLNRTDLGINSLNTLANIAAFPNPASNTLFINSTVKIDQIEITNTLGTIVYSDKSLSEGLHPIDIKNLSEGVYFAKLSCENNTHIIKFVKTN